VSRPPCAALGRQTVRGHPACPGVVNQEHVGALGQPGVRTEVFWVDFARVSGRGGGREVDIAARGWVVEYPTQGMLPGLGRPGRHGCQ
jgi:hypothetical protein